DREILNKTVDHIVHLENQKLTLYTGNYDQFERRRAERLVGQQALHEKQMAQKAKMMEFVDRFRAKASKARQAQSRLKMIEKMDIVDAVMAERVTQFTFPEPEEEKSPMIVLENLDAGYTKGKPVLKNLNLRIDADDRIALLGANGNGKSTLMKLLSGRLPPLAGAMHKSGKLRVGYFAQFQTDELDVTQTPYAVMRHAMKTSAEAHIRAALAKFGFDKHKADTKVGELSGGEKARLLFCLMSYDAPHIMLLDEPTNHLDIDARQALTQALNAYSGAVILVSHDAQLVESVVDRLWLVADGTCKPFDDDLEAYRKLVVQQRKREREDVKQQAKNQKNDNKKKNDSLEKEAAKLEKKIGELKLNRDTVENDIANAFSANNTKQLKDLNTRLSELDAQLLAAEAELEALIVKL
ncbi:MAG: ABC transporter ATP-binding protein, partial [Proteobacteria bacterium]|nr:ABC transporter ATP-binding protein [Pseudomonadota bacterium]